VQDNEKKRLIDFRESFEEERKGQQARCISQERLDTFPKEKLSFECAEIYCCERGRIVRIHTIRTTEKSTCFSRQGRHKKQGRFEGIFC
jgi:hypothetical protein